MSELAKIEEIYHAALDVDPDERKRFVAQACEADTLLHDEVMSLLDSHSRSEHFMESPPEDLAASLLFDQNSSDLVGSVLGNYRVVAHIGSGGMGEVYMAEDVNLGRKAALKILPALFSADPERKSRLRQEALAASALNHPNIITIYGIEHSGDVSYIATEFIDGKTLRELISEGSIGWEKAVEIAIQTLAALEAAHSVGIIHRDIKPANIMIRHDGYVKVLDFGLAKVVGHKEILARDLTKAGTVMGTVAYMSPEQALGEKVDFRTDIYSLGMVLYEMLSGEHPFPGTNEGALYNAAINQTPPSITATRSNIPIELDRIVARMIAKKASDRYQSAQEARQDLIGFQQRTISGAAFHTAAEPKRPFPKYLMPVAAAFLLVCSAIAYFAFFSEGAAPAGQAVAAKKIGFTQFTSEGDAVLPNISPDGKTVIFSSRRAGNWDVYFQRIGGSNAINLTEGSDADDLQAVYSPNGDQIAFRSERSGGGIFLMGATGENVRKLSDSGYHPAFSPDGKQLVYSMSGFEDPIYRHSNIAALWVLDLESGQRREIYKGDAVQPAWSPSGERIAFWSLDHAGIRDIKTIPSSGGEATPVTSDAALDWNPVWSVDGKHLYFASNRAGNMNFWRVGIDQRSGEVLGAAEPFTLPSAYSQHLAFAPGGKMFAFVQMERRSNIVKMEFDEKKEAFKGRPSEVTTGARLDRNVSVSPDGERLAFDSTKDGQADLYLIRTDGKGLIQLTDDIHRDRAPKWSPDGGRLIFYSDRSGTSEAWSIDANGSGLTRVTSNPNTFGVLSIYSRDGKRLLQNINEGFPKIWDTSIPFSEQTPFQMPDDGVPNAWALAYSFSPDGNKIALGRMGRAEDLSGVLIYSLVNNKYEQMTDFGETAMWLSDSRRVMFFHRDKVYLLDTATKKTKEIFTADPGEVLQSLTISNDDRNVFLTMQSSESNILIGTIE